MWTLSSTPTWENENFVIAIIISIIIIITIIIAIIIIIIIIFVVVVVGDNTYYGVTCPPTVHFKFITKCDKCYYKVRQNKVSVLKDSQKVTVERQVGVRVASAPVSHGFQITDK